MWEEVLLLEIGVSVANLSVKWASRISAEGKVVVTLYIESTRRFNLVSQLCWLRYYTYKSISISRISLRWN